VVSALYTTVSGPRKPEGALTAIQLLWVNLIMDTLAALAFATDKPSDSLLERKPLKKSDPIISRPMFKQIIGQAFYQIVVCLVVYFGGPGWFNQDSYGASFVPAGGFETVTIVFNTFIFCQLFNEINCRSITSDSNVFRNFFDNYIFHLVIAFSITCQAFIIAFGGKVFEISPAGLSWTGWLISIALGSGTLVVGYVLRLMPDPNPPRWMLGGTLDEAVASEDAEVGLNVGNILPSSPGTVAQEPDSPDTIARKRWNKAIKTTVAQVSVAKKFRTYVRSLRREGEWRSSAQLGDPRVVAEARRAVAVLKQVENSN
jgi:Ca2+-transporting ATPase